MEFFFKQKNSKGKLSSVINEYNETDKQIIKRFNKIIILLKNLFEKN